MVVRLAAVRITGCKGYPAPMLKSSDAGAIWMLFVGKPAVHRKNSDSGFGAVLFTLDMENRTYTDDYIMQLFKISM